MMMMGASQRTLCILTATLVGLVLSYPAAARAQCTKDTDCKGSRICTAGSCAEPPAAPSASEQVEATTPPSRALPLSCVCQTMAAPAPVPAARQAPASPLTAASEPTVSDAYGGASVRLSAGLGSWHTGFSHPQPSTIPAADASGLSAIAITLGAAVGGAVSRHLTVFGEVLGSRATDVSVKDSAGTRTTWRGSYGLISVGPGVCYRFDRLGLYATGTLAITRLFGKEIDANLGWGTNLGLGKEWRASSQWRTGVAATVQYARANDEYRGTTVSMVSSLRFSLAWH